MATRSYRLLFTAGLAVVLIPGGVTATAYALIRNEVLSLSVFPGKVVVLEFMDPPRPPPPTEPPPQPVPGSPPAPNPLAHHPPPARAVTVRQQTSNPAWINIALDKYWSAPSSVPRSLVPPVPGFGDRA